MADNPEREPPPTLVECSMCHRKVPENQVVALAGRRLCYGCASAWFGDDEADDE